MSLDATTASPAASATTATANDGSTVWPPGVIWRDIARGGIAGIVVGFVVAGFGGRIAMRLAALLVPEAGGALTENGNRIGDITTGGSLGLILFGGLVVGLFGGTLWVIVRPWLPGAGLGRALLTGVVTIGLGTFGLIRGDNGDFVVLGYDPRVVAVLIGLVGLIGCSISLVDEWLDRRLPLAASLATPATSVYAAISLIGVLLILPLVIAAYLGGEMRLAGVGIVVVGLATLRWWMVRARGATRPSGTLLAVGRGSLAVTVLLGLAAEVPEIAGALGTT